MRRYLPIMLSLCGLQIAHGQTGSTCDYWFDSNYADRQTVSMQDGSWNSEIDVGSLTDAVHTVHFQVTDESGRQTPTASHLFVKYPPKITTTAEVPDGNCYYWFDSDYANGVQTAIGNGTLTLNTGQLTDGVHTVHFYASGTALTPVVSHLFVKWPARVEPETFTADGTCRYWFDDDYSGSKSMATGTGIQTIDVSKLRAGVHTIHLQGNGTALTPTASKLFVILPEKAMAETRITGYDYWLNGDGQATSVTLPEPVSPLSLVDLLPVASQPLRSSCFHFAVEEGQPTIYAKNDIRLRFYASQTCFTDMKARYVDYSVKEKVSNFKLLQANTKLTEDKPAQNTIVWYQLEAEAGDVLQFRLDKAATIQVFSPTGQELYAASGADAMKWGDVNAEETGTFYVALHDVTATKGSTVNIEYEHTDKYAVLSQDVVAVGNGGPSTITFRGNGFDALTSIDLVQGTTTIGSTEVSASGKATASVKFDFNEAPLGDYKAVFHFQDEDLTLDNCLSVEETVPVMVSSTVAYASSFLLSRGNTYSFKLKNHGNMTAYDYPVMITTYSTDASSLKMLSIDGEELDDYSETLVSDDYDGYPYKRVYNLSRTLRPGGTEPLIVMVKTSGLERVHVYLGNAGGPSDAVASLDPNDIYGYQDANGDKTIRDGMTQLFYTIEFENDPEFATAPAHDIYVTDVLSPELFDLSTFVPTQVRIGSKEVQLDGSKNGTVTFSMMPEIYAIAQLDWSLDETTGTVSWHISSLDPLTVEPTEELNGGVLPVNVDGNGIGELSFDIQIRPNLPDGTEIPNRATIVFDENEPIETATWTNTVENLPTGDVNGDGAVNLTDAQWIVRSYVGRTPEGFVQSAADVNRDGSVNLSDAQKVVRIFVGKDN